MWKMENTKSFFCLKIMFLVLVQMLSTIKRTLHIFYSIFPQQFSLETVNPTLTGSSGKSSILCLEKLRLKGSQHFKVHTRSKWLRQEHSEFLFYFQSVFISQKKKKKTLSEQQKRKEKALLNSLICQAAPHVQFHFKSFFLYSTDGFHKSWSKLRD